MDTRARLGRDAEDAAAALYRRLRFRILDRNWCCRDGEIDLVAARGSLVVFCEVKARRTRHFGEPSEAVGVRKQLRLRRLAGQWLQQHRARYARVRFDVVSIVVTDTDVEVNHIADAF
jgi:putative endonuclease